MNRFELVIHPIRMRIIMAASHRILTPQQIAKILPDIAQTTLYRHINLLIEGGVLEVVRETKVRGTVERELRFAPASEGTDMGVFAALSPEAQAAHFINFVSMLLSEFVQAQENPISADVPAAYYGKNMVYATPTEAQAITHRINAIFAEFSNPQRQSETGDTQPYSFTGIVIHKKSEDLSDS